MYWLRLEDGVACLHGMGGSSHCCRHCWMALTEMEMILDWERGNHYAVVVVAAAVAEDVVGLAKVASGRIEAVQGSRRPRRLVPCCCQWIRSSREGHCLNKTKKTYKTPKRTRNLLKLGPYLAGLRLSRIAANLCTYWFSGVANGFAVASRGIA